MGEIEVGKYFVEWDDKKAELNWKKHKVYFEDARMFFLMMTELRIMTNYIANTRTDGKLLAK